MFDKFKSLFTDSARADKINWIFRGTTKDTQKMTTAKEFFENSLYLNKAIQKRAEVISGLELRAIDEKGEEQEDIQKILREPNDLLAGRDFLGVIQKHFDIYGQFFVLKQMGGSLNGEGKRLEALHVLNPER